jgi:streptomycin 6-kinase
MAGISWPVTEDLFATWIALWQLTPDGAAFRSRLGSHLLPVLSENRPAILKVSSEHEEIRGGALMEWWAGEGAAQVLAREDTAILLERATGTESLAEMVREGDDDEATRLLCQCAAALHSARPKLPPDTLVPLDVWFRALGTAADREGGIFARALPLAQELLDVPRDIVVLHGDFHHDNILDFGDRGWLAIDPKGLLGERDFEFANLFRNPDAETALAKGRMKRQIEIVAAEAFVDPNRLLKWIFVYAALGAAWSIESKHDPEAGIEIAGRAESDLAP